MDIIYFITGILSTFVAILLYQYNKILTSYKLIQRNHKQVTEAYETWIKSSTEQLDDIRSKLDVEEYATATDLNQRITAVSTQLYAVETQINTLAKKEINDFKKLEDGLQQITTYIKGVVNSKEDNRGY